MAGRRAQERSPLLPLLVVSAAVAAVLLSPLAHGAPASGEDPFPRMLGGEKVTRPSSVLLYDDVPLDRDPSIQLPCLGARYCECSAEGGWNHTFWLNTASATFRGEVYVVILNRVTLFRPTITFQQTKQSRRNQVMEANSLFFCKADLLSARVSVRECRLVEPQQEYRERHPFPTHQHFNLVGLIDPRLMSAGDDHGLFLQVGCRPKELADKHETTKFRETPCLFKLLDGRPGASSGGGGGSAAQERDPAAGAGGSTAVATLQRRRSALSSSGSGATEAAGQGRSGQSLLAHRNGGSGGELAAAAHGQSQPPQQQRQDQRWWRRRAQRALRLWSEGSAASGSGGQQAGRCAAPRGRQLWQALFRRWLLTDSNASVEMQAPNGGSGGVGSPAAGAAREAGGEGGPAALLSQGMAEVAKDWPEGRMQVLRYTSGDQLPCEKNWVGFEYQGRLLWLRHLSPQEVVTVHANSTVTTLYRNANQRLFKPLSVMCGKGPRGNSPAIRITKEQTGLSRDFYLGILHWTPQRGAVNSDTLERQCHEYINFFFLMEAEPPFNIVEVARPPIPLVAATQPVYERWPLQFGMGYISFPTGMVVVDGKVVITYGVGDRNVRVWRAALRDVLLTFSSEIAVQVPVPSPPPPPPALPPPPATR